MQNDIWLGETEDSTDYVLCGEWERRLLDLASPKTPTGFQAAVKQTFPAEVMTNWQKHCWGNRRRSWEGIKTAAKQMHMHADFDSQVSGHGDTCLVQTAANAIFSALPQIYGPIARDRNKRLREWERLDFCRLCWRLAPAGAASARRIPTCEHHKPRSKSYQRHFRLLPKFKEKFRQTWKEIGSFIEWDGSLSKFPHLKNYIDNKNGKIYDIECILNLLLLDVNDPENKIKRTIKYFIDHDRDFIFGTFLYAETWLSLIASKPHGGDRKSKNSDSTYSAQFIQKAVKRALRSNKPVAQTAKKLDIPVSTLATWVKKAKRSNS